MNTYAQKSCTLSAITNVKAIYTYYYLSNTSMDSNIAPKNKNNISEGNPPDENHSAGYREVNVSYNGQIYKWVDVEPSLNVVNNVIQNEAIGQLYVIECVKFTDNTFNWGPMLTSSTYAASKAAYNLAHQAKQITELMGGHFIYKSTDTTKTIDGQSVVTTPAGAGVIRTLNDDPANWGFNTWIGSNGIQLRNGENVLSEWIGSKIGLYNNINNNTLIMDNNGINLSNGSRILSISSQDINIVDVNNSISLNSVGIDITNGTNKLLINSNGIELYNNSNSPIANFSDKIQLGFTDQVGSYISIEPDEDLDIIKGIQIHKVYEETETIEDDLTGESTTYTYLRDAECFTISLNNPTARNPYIDFLALGYNFDSPSRRSTQVHFWDDLYFESNDSSQDTSYPHKVQVKLSASENGGATSHSSFEIECKKLSDTVLPNQSPYIISHLYFDETGNLECNNVGVAVSKTSDFKVDRLTGTSCTVNSVRKSGNMMMVSLGIATGSNGYTPSSPVTNLYTGTIGSNTGASYNPAQTTTGIGYINNVGVVGQITTGGELIVRPLGTLPASKTVYIYFTYFM